MITPVYCLLQVTRYNRQQHAHRHSMSVSVCVYVSVCMCLCVCVCVWEDVGVNYTWVCVGGRGCELYVGVYIYFIY